MITQLKLKRKKQRIERDITRVICKLLIPGGDMGRIKNIIQRVLELPKSEAETLLKRILHDFSERHKNIKTIFDRHFKQISNFIPKNTDSELSIVHQQLIGAYFTMEYSIEAAALFNPSIVKHPDQSGLPEGSIRFIMSLRAVGEGHISSIVFRSGIIDRQGTLFFDHVSPFVDTPDVHINPVYECDLFQLKLNEIGIGNEIADYILEQLPERFSYKQLKEQMTKLNEQPMFLPTHQLECFNNMHWLVNSNYQLYFHEDHELSERVIFPVSEDESRGIEDSRFVQFYDNGDVIYYATYTAYNGNNILPQLIETRDFKNFKISSLHGNAVQNKGMALFPRKINGQYVMLSRQDGENNHIMFSNNLHHWEESSIIQRPRESWEFVQIGNCGSPLETHRGWLVLTHGVGPMREYSISAILLDLDDPTRIVARLREPLLRSHDLEREGYVPNVVYTCGSILHHDELIIPYSWSDLQTVIASVDAEELLEAMQPE